MSILKPVAMTLLILSLTTHTKANLIAPTSAAIRSFTKALDYKNRFIPANVTDDFANSINTTIRTYSGKRGAAHSSVFFDEVAMLRFAKLDNDEFLSLSIDGLKVYDNIPVPILEVKYGKIVTKATNNAEDVPVNYSDIRSVAEKIERAIKNMAPLNTSRSTIETLRFSDEVQWNFEITRSLTYTRLPGPQNQAIYKVQEEFNLPLQTMTEGDLEQIFVALRKAIGKIEREVEIQL